MTKHPPSLVFALVPGDAPPDEALARAAVETGEQGAVIVEAADFERTGGSERDTDAAWTMHVEAAGAVFRVSAERAPLLHDWHWRRPRWGEGEEAAARAATWAISVEGRLEDPPLRSLQEQLALAAALAPESPAVFDEPSLRLWSRSELRALASSKAGLGVHELASLHAVEPGAERLWIHTHGLARAGVPDMDALLVPRSAQDVVGELLNATASLLLGHGTPATGSPFPVGEGVEVVLLGLDDALARIPPDAKGGRDARDADHREATRLVLAPVNARRDGSPSLEGIVERARKGPFFRSYEATERMRVLARERWSEFVRLFHQHRSTPGFVFLVKLGYEPDRARERQEELAREHLWFRVKSIEDDRIEAVQESSPLDIAALRKGDIRKHDLERLTEWLVITPAGRIRPDQGHPGP